MSPTTTSTNNKTTVQAIQYMEYPHQVQNQIGHSNHRQQQTTQSIPISNALCRTPSEIQLRMDEAIADERDYIFFSRLVHGMSHMQCKDRALSYQNQACLAHVINTRNQEVPKAITDEWSFGYDYDEPLNNNIMSLQDLTATALRITEESAADEGIFDIDL